MRPLPQVGNEVDLKRPSSHTSLYGNSRYREKRKDEKRFFKLLDNMLCLENEEHGFYEILDDIILF